MLPTKRLYLVPIFTERHPIFMTIEKRFIFLPRELSEALTIPTTPFTINGLSAQVLVQGLIEYSLQIHDLVEKRVLNQLANVVTDASNPADMFILLCEEECIEAAKLRFLQHTSSIECVVLDLKEDHSLALRGAICSLEAEYKTANDEPIVASWKISMIEEEGKIRRIATHQFS